MKKRKRGNNPPILYKKWLLEHKEAGVKEVIEAIAESTELGPERIDKLSVSAGSGKTIIFAYMIDIFWNALKILLLLFLIFCVFIALIVLINEDFRNYLIDGLFYMRFRFFLDNRSIPMSL